MRRLILPVLGSIALFFIGTFVATLATLAGGMLLNRVNPIGIIPATALFLTTGAVLTVTLGWTIVADRLTDIAQTLRYLDDTGWKNDEDEFEEEEELEFETARSTGTSPGLTRTTDSIPAAGRNQPCPCGSGRKYKKCCIQKVNADTDDEIISF